MEMLNDFILLQQGINMGFRLRKAKPIAHILLVDDDRLFCRMLEKTAKQLGVSVLSCNSIDEIRYLAVAGVFDAAIVDYHLEGAKANLKGTVIAERLKKTPTLLISSSKEVELDSDVWPRAIRGFINKQEGMVNIVRKALSFV